jgi:RNA polymerase sigma-70 factor, ECF subfamily
MQLELAPRKPTPGDPAFERLWSAERERVRRLCVRLSGDPEAAEDLTQEVALKAHAALGSFRGSARAATWLHRIAVNVVLRWREQQKPTLPLDALVERPGPDSDTLRVRLAIERLPDDQRTPLVLSALEGWSIKEIAATLEIPQGTVLSRLHRARTRLREELSDDIL